MSVGYLFSGMLGHLPLLAVLIAGFVLVATRRERLGPRGTLLARLGLGALLLASLLQFAWQMLIPVLYESLDYSATQYGIVFGLIGLITSVISAAGVGLLIAAAVSRNPGPGFAGAPFDGGQPFAGPPPPGGQPYGGSPPAGGQPFGNAPPGGPSFGNASPGGPSFGNPSPGGQPLGEAPPGGQPSGNASPGGQSFGTGDRPAG
jgi:hypothetical protein